MINPWGMAIQKSEGKCRTVWVALNQTNRITSFDLSGNVAYSDIKTDQMFPTGLVLNNSCSGFPITNTKNASLTGPSFLIVAGENGSIAGYNPDVDCENVIPVVQRVGVIFPTYKGLAIRDFLYAANFSSGYIEYYNNSWTFIGEFTDTTLTALGYAPFNVAVIKCPESVCITCSDVCKCKNIKMIDRLFVTFALRDSSSTTVVPGTGNGAISVFTLDGHFLYNFITGAPLNAPWGITTINSGKQLIVSNFGDGKVNVFDMCTHKWLGSFANCNGQKVVIDGIWSLGKTSNRLYFTAGIDGERAGLFGYVK
jgi:hypothetical protein